MGSHILIVMSSCGMVNRFRLKPSDESTFNVSGSPLGEKSFLNCAWSDSCNQVKASRTQTYRFKVAQGKDKSLVCPVLIPMCLSQVSSKPHVEHRRPALSSSPFSDLSHLQGLNFSNLICDEVDCSPSGIANYEPPTSL